MSFQMDDFYEHVRQVILLPKGVDAAKVVGIDTENEYGYYDEVTAVVEIRYLDSNGRNHYFYYDYGLSMFLSELSQ